LEKDLETAKVTFNVTEGHWY